ncbi:hypothetical protein BDZ94DRAFT_358354 [Collybia nuda]|uniref:Zinc finger protein n=1 Tax=Collybia nuda TaxID=64659 RepID=A0A9P5YI94_9AGAR|nr:hypothetical protein BDZ94DRAFT_358354 [Collybia nuda]
MGGDNKCPVCQATFTRLHHVARHMRTHTGDRPYKCRYCGDQFARSDLLSRHINKCHSNERLLPNVPWSRKKDSASASRATTSKQACDQCVQSRLPCDGCNPCVKCVQRKYFCTFVQFHRQTAPVGPGHNPRLYSGTSSISISQPTPPPSLNSHSSRLRPYTYDNHRVPVPTGSKLGVDRVTMGDSQYSNNASFSAPYPTSGPSSPSYVSPGSSSYHVSASSSKSDTIPLTANPGFTDKYRTHTDIMHQTGLGTSRTIGAGRFYEGHYVGQAYSDHAYIVGQGVEMPQAIEDLISYEDLVALGLSTT